MDTFPLGLLNGWGAAGVIVACGWSFMWALTKGHLCTGRELQERNQRVRALEQALRTRDRQLTLVLTETMTTISPVLKAMRAAVDSEELQDDDGTDEGGP